MEQRIAALEATILDIRSTLVSVLHNSDEMTKAFRELSRQIPHDSPKKASKDCGFATCPFKPPRCSASSAILHMQHCAYGPEGIPRHIFIVEHILQKFHHPRTDLADVCCCWCNGKFGPEHACPTRRSVHRKQCSLRVLEKLRNDPNDSDCIITLNEIWSSLSIPSDSDSPRKRERNGTKPPSYSPPVTHIIASDLSNTIWELDLVRGQDASPINFFADDISDQL